jgi:predicted nucleic acid binding AN1-type Zn finger protein
MVYAIYDAYKNLKQIFHEIYNYIVKNEQFQNLDNDIIIKTDTDFFRDYSQKTIELIKNLTETTNCGLAFHNNYLRVNKSIFVLEAAKYLNIDISILSKLLNWKEFEDLISRIFEKNEFTIVKNFRFTDHSNYYRKTNQKRYEIDVIALLGSIILLIDAKHWSCKTNNQSSINKASELQLRRMYAMAKNPDVISKLIPMLLNHYKTQKVKNFIPFKMIPIIVTLVENKIRLTYSQVPIVSIFHLNKFIQELDFNQKYFVFEKISNITIQKRIF